MSIHKLTAGSGYDYLTRQVAALDATEKGHVPLAGYYTERGETPGVWIGSGLAGIDGLNAGDPVTAEQMRALFGVGPHPLASHRQQQLQGPDLSSRDYLAVTRLDAPFRIYNNDIPPFRVEVANRIADLNAAAGLPRDWPIPRDERARVRTEVATEFFTAEHGRPPQDAREVAAAIAKYSRPQTTAVAGYDLTFSPVKSVSTLWALAEPAVAAQIEKAHRAAVSDALAFIEQHALFSRTGADGVRQRRNSAGTLSPEPGTYGSGGARPATAAGTAFPVASLTAVSLPAPNTMSATTGCCPTTGAPHREQPRAAAATSAAHSQHLIGTHPAATPGTLAG